eukprot:TRINITY_DN99_c0_g1_i13.p1 TRINITY_DN99_c0_g1~~TRINITY_DN99_c0_g1_i13.p1  ORF type:complete len:1453 (+),score=369.44 TRINITY_DN99_c0_g1_i13:47-4405(+)
MNIPLLLMALAAIATVSSAQGANCLPMDSSRCDCSWANPSVCTDDGSECTCMCCCPMTGSCDYNNGGGGGGGSSSCTMPAGVPTDPASVNNRDFIACHGKLGLGGSSGLQLVDESGSAVQLIGISSHGLHWFPNCYTKESITFLVENWGINVFRASMYVGEGGYATNPNVKNKVKEIVQWCKELGIYVIIDWHMLTPGNPNDATYSGAADFWNEMATLYKDEKHVLYEVANEPNGVSWSEVKQYLDNMIDVIRAVDSETIIICGTPTWSQDIDQPAAIPVARPYHVMYTFHFYAGSHISLLGRVEQYASQIPIFVTEWGTTQATGDVGPYFSETMQFLNLFASAGSAQVSISFVQWSFADKDEDSAALMPGSCGTQSWDTTSCSGTFLKNFVKSKVQTCSGAPPVPTSPPTPQPPTTPTPPSTPAPPTPTTAPSPSNCIPMDSSKCDCGWANAGTCGSDDGSLCNCMCCCSYTGSCNYNGGGGGGGGGSNCAMPAGVPSDPAPVNNRDFVACHGKLSLGGSSGLQLVDENGDAVQLIGMSSHGLHWFPNCYTKESITFLVENWGINLFRAAMYVGEGGYASNPSVKDTVKDIVQWCKELGIYAMIDWHMLSPGNPNDATYSGAADFWREMATLYKDEKHVLYEVANEPNGVGWSEVKQYHDGIIDVIRAVDSETIIICGTPTWSQDIDQAAANPVAKPYNVMYAFHFYAGTHTSLLGRVEQVASQIPLFVTEWGTSQASGDGGPYLSEAMQFLDLFASAGSSKVSLSFAQWSYADKNEVSAALTSNACSSKSWDSTSCSGTFLKNYIKSKVSTCSGATPTSPSPPVVTDVPAKPTAIPTDAPQPPVTDAPVITDVPRPVTDAPVPSDAPKVTDVPKPVTDAPVPTDVPKPVTDAPKVTDVPRPVTDAPAPTDVPKPVTNAPVRTDVPKPVTDAPVPSDAPKVTDVPKPVTDAPVPTDVPKPVTDVPVPTTDSPAVTPTPPRMCAEWDDCTASPTCCPPNTQCFKKDDHYSQCRVDCAPFGWECSPHAPTDAPMQPTAAPTTPPTAAPVPETAVPSSSPSTTSDSPVIVSDAPTTAPTCKEWDSCHATPNCCPSGTQCFKKDDYYSQCRVECPTSGWECTSVPPTPATLTPGNNNVCGELIGKWGGCIASPYCCDAGLKCFEKNVHYAQCLPECDSSTQANDGWTCRDLGNLSKNPSELGDAGKNAPRCACEDWQTDDVYCTDETACSFVPKSGTCPEGEKKCFGNSKAASKARRVISFVLKSGVASFDEDAFKQLVKKALRDEAAVVLVKYLCPASSCPGGQCSDPFGAASTCLSNYDLETRSLLVLQGDTEEGSVVGFEIEGNNDEGLQEAYKARSLPGVVFASDKWEAAGYDDASSEPASKEDGGSSSLGMILGIVFGSLGCLLVVAVAAVLVHRRSKGAATESFESFSTPMSNAVGETSDNVNYTTHTV